MKEFVAMATWIMIGVLFNAFMEAQSALSTSNTDVEYLGNRIRPSRSGVEVSGVTFLLSNPNPTIGIAFAYSGHIREQSAIRYQIWRKTTPTSDRDFFLVSELYFVPSVVDQREDVYVESRLTEDCTMMLPGDRFGVYFEERPSAIGYVFDGTAPDALGYTLPNASDPTVIGQAVTFDALVFPYDFSAAVWVYTNVSIGENATSSMVECPRGMKIPAYTDDPDLPSTTSQPPPTGAPGATGPTGPQGPGGATGEIGPLGAIGQVGPIGATGVMGPQGFNGTNGDIGATGVEGDDGEHGATGATGPQGFKGDIGVAGPPGPPGQAANATEAAEGPEAGASTAEVSLMSETIILILLIWLAIVTILLFVMIIIVCCLCRRKTKEKFRRSSAYGEYVNSYNSTPLPESKSRSVDHMDEIPETNGAVNGKIPEKAIPRGLGVSRTDGSNSLGWMGSMREDETAEYSVDTIQRMNSKRLAARNGGEVNLGMVDEQGKRLSVSREEVNNY